MAAKAKKNNEKTDNIVKECACASGVCVSFSAQAGKRTSRSSVRETHIKQQRQKGGWGGEEGGHQRNGEDHEEQVLTQAELASIGPTVFWLSCNNISALVGKLEFFGGVSFFEEQIQTSQKLRDEYVASHDDYVRVLKEDGWMDAQLHAAFVDKFVAKDPLAKTLAESGATVQLAQRKRRGEEKIVAVQPEGAKGNSGKDESNETAYNATSSSSHPTTTERFKDGLHGQRRFGNASVSCPTDVKCLHAQIGGCIGGVACPIGCAVANYILFLDQEIQLRSNNKSDAAPPVEVVQDRNSEVGRKREETSTTHAVVDESPAIGAASSIIPSVKDLSHFRSFLKECSYEECFGLHLDRWFPRGEQMQGKLGAVEEDDAAASARTADAGLCSAAERILIAIDGHGPRARKKRRLN